MAAFAVDSMSMNQQGARIDLVQILKDWEIKF